MSSTRSTKSRSLGVNPKQPANPTPRPALGERHKSAPSVPRKHRDSASRAAKIEHGSGARSRRSSAVRSTTSQTRVNSKSRNPSSVNATILKLVVVGNSNVGKSTFIKYALELPTISSSPISSSWVSLRGIVYRVQMIELRMDDIEIQDGQHVMWPEYVDKVPFNSPDAVVCLYDVAKKESLDTIPQFLTALANLDIPVQLVPLRLDKSARDSEVALSFTDQVHKKLPQVVIADLESTLSETAQRSMLVALKTILSDASNELSITPRADEQGRFDEDDSSNGTPVPASASMARGDACSISSTDEEDDSEDENDSEQDNHVAVQRKNLRRLHVSTSGNSPTLYQAPQTPVSESGPFSIQTFSSSSKGQPEGPQTPESYQNISMRRPGTSDTSDSRVQHTFFYTGEDSSEEQDRDKFTSKVSIQTQADSTAEQGIPFPDLVQRLLRVPTTKHESKFAPTFLCLYRAFATPENLLTEFIHRFNVAETSEDNQFNQVSEHLRYLQIMANWTANYPGDFAAQAVRDIAVAFVHEVEARKNLASAAKEIGNNLRVCAEDEDAIWSYNGPDTGDDPVSRKGSISDAYYGADDTEESETDDELREMRSSLRNSETASTASSLLKPIPASSQSATNLAVLDNAREEAKRLRSIPHIGLSKLQWHFFMETPTEDLARELARVDWIRYAAIRPRDFVREVSHPGKRRSGNNISLMVKHFNQVSFFVAGMILLRDKPKHRAKTVEKVMDLAWKVRQLNDYNCVSAIVAGMQNISITRLQHTMELVPTETQRQFMRLNVLVDATKSYATYRIAWENTTSPRIPLIPALRKDLKVAVLANPTFLGDNVNWKKFEIMGDAILSIQKSQATPYTFPERTQQVQDILRLFLETKIIERSDDTIDPSKELYDRSKQIEPQATSHETKKRFDWLRR